MTGVTEHAEHLSQLVGLGGRDARLVVSPPSRREETRSGAVALRQGAGGEDTDGDEGKDDDSGDLLGEVTERKGRNSGDEKIFRGIQRAGKTTKYH